MDIQVKDVNFNADQGLLDDTKRKIEKLYLLYDHIVSVDVNLKLENNGVDDNKTSEIIVKVPGNELFAKKTMSSFEKATDASLDALKKQVDKYKGKQSTH
jgi:putative sigma-54 modulation protein